MYQFHQLVNVKAATDHDWRALECVRTNRIGGTIRLMRSRPGDEECTTLLQEGNPSVVIGNLGPGESWANIVQAFVRSKARTLLLECTPRQPNAELWCTNVELMLYESYQTEKTELKASSVGVPSGKNEHSWPPPPPRQPREQRRNLWRRQGRWRGLPVPPPPWGAS